MPDAGTLIAFDPVTEQVMYETFDELFRYYCCNRQGGCKKFTDARPIDMGFGYGPQQGGNFVHSKRLK